MSDIRCPEFIEVGRGHRLPTSSGLRVSRLHRPSDAFDSPLNDTSQVLTDQQLAERGEALGRIAAQRTRVVPEIRVI